MVARELTVAGALEAFVADLSRDDPVFAEEIAAAENGEYDDATANAMFDAMVRAALGRLGISNATIDFAPLAAMATGVEMTVAYLKALQARADATIERAREQDRILTEFHALPRNLQERYRPMKVSDARHLVLHALTRSCSRPRGARRAHRPRRNARTRPARARAPGRLADEPPPEPDLAAAPLGGAA